MDDERPAAVALHAKSCRWVVRLCLLAAQRTLKLCPRLGDLGFLLLPCQSLGSLKLRDLPGQSGKLLLRFFLGRQALPLPGVVQRGGSALFEPFQAGGKLALLRPELLQLGAVLVRHFGQPPRQFPIELCPPGLLRILLLLQDEADGFLRAKLRHAGEVPHAEPLKYLRAAEFALAEAQRALDG